MNISNTTVAVSTASTQILISKYQTPIKKKKTGLLWKTVTSRTEAREIEDEPGASYSGRKQQVLVNCVWDPMDSTSLSSSVHEILQARILEWVAISFSGGSSWPSDRTRISCIAGRFFTMWATREAPESNKVLRKWIKSIWASQKNTCANLKDFPTAKVETAGTAKAIIVLCNNSTIK